MPSWWPRAPCAWPSAGAPRAPGTFAPPVSLLKPLHGLEPDLESHLQSFFEQDYPEFEIIFCARTDQDAGLEIARRVAARYPKIRSRFLCSGNAPYANAKVWSLERCRMPHPTGFS